MRTMVLASMVAVGVLGVAACADPEATTGGEGPAEVAGTTSPPAPSEAEAATTAAAAAEDVAGTTAAAADACILVDATDAERILGAPAEIDDSGIGGFNETSSCAWITADEALLVVTLFEGQQFYAEGLPGSEPLDVGDRGHIHVEPTLGGVELQVVSGNWVLGLAVTPFGVVDVDGLPANTTEVARQAVDRLP